MEGTMAITWLTGRGIEMPLGGATAFCRERVHLRNPLWPAYLCKSATPTPAKTGASACKTITYSSFPEQPHPLLPPAV
jgi:hypothetical protein